MLANLDLDMLNVDATGHREKTLEQLLDPEEARRQRKAALLRKAERDSDREYYSSDDDDDSDEDSLNQQPSKRQDEPERGSLKPSKSVNVISEVLDLLVAEIRRVQVNVYSEAMRGQVLLRIETVRAHCRLHVAPAARTLAETPSAPTPRLSQKRPRLDTKELTSAHGEEAVSPLHLLCKFGLENLEAFAVPTGIDDRGVMWWDEQSQGIFKSIMVPASFMADLQFRRLPDDIHDINIRVRHACALCVVISHC